jgi:DNA polymerase III epsilon subunit family exonuclease
VSTTVPSQAHDEEDPGPGDAGAPHGDRRLDDLRLCVVDLETTGGAPGRSRITEIGAVRLRGLRPDARFSTLVDPGCPIPEAVRALTGIDDDLVRGCPAIDVALPRFAAFAGADVLVAHNAPFDLRFLNYERRRIHGSYFAQPWVDTLGLARALLAGEIERHDLATLAAWAGTAVRPAHRALPDAEATAEVLVRLLALARARGAETLRDLDSLALSGGRPAYTPKLALCEDLPAGPGVYVLRSASGTPLHAGAAADLRREVRRFLVDPRPDRARVVVATESVEHRAHGSWFAAALSCDELRRHLLLTAQGAPPRRYLTVEDGPRGLRVGVVTVRGGEPPAGAYGPVRGERRAKAAASALQELFGHERPSSRRARAEELRALLRGDERALRRMRRRIARARPAPDAAPPAALAPRRLGCLLEVLAQLGGEPRTRTGDGVLVERGPEPGTAEVFFIAAGLPVRRAVVSRGDWRSAARRGLSAIRGGGAEGVAASAGRLVGERLAQRGAHPSVVRLAPAWDPDRALAAVGAAVDAVLGGGAERAA